MVGEKNSFISNAWHNLAKSKVISKCKNDKPWKNYVEKVPVSSFKNTCHWIIFSPPFLPLRVVIKRKGVWTMQTGYGVCRLESCWYYYSLNILRVLICGIIFILPLKFNLRLETLDCCCKKWLVNFRVTQPSGIYLSKT